MKRNVFFCIFILVAILLFFMFARTTDNGKEITNFEECIVAGNPAMESYPRQCIDAKWGHFVEDIIENEIPIQAIYDSHIVYTLDASLATEPFVDDCRVRGGVFNSCGSSCAPEAEICVAVCAYTCALPQ